MIKISIDIFVINKDETLEPAIKTEIDKLQNLLHINKGKKYKQHYQKKTVIHFVREQTKLEVGHTVGLSYARHYLVRTTTALIRTIRAR